MTHRCRPPRPTWVWFLLRPVWECRVCAAYWYACADGRWRSVDP